MYAPNAPVRKRATKAKPKEGNSNKSFLRKAELAHHPDGSSSVVYNDYDLHSLPAPSKDGSTSDTSNTPAQAQSYIPPDVNNFLQSLNIFEPPNYHSSAEADNFQQQFLDDYNLPQELDNAPIPESLESRKQTKTQNDYISEFVSHIEKILPASISGEYLDSDQKHCKDCLPHDQQLGIWKCTDCFDDGVYCRKCMRKRHIANPFHRIQCWLGDHFRTAALWEVGVYVLPPHHKSSTRSACTTRNSLLEIINNRETHKDNEEHRLLKDGHFPATPSAEPTSTDPNPPHAKTNAEGPLDPASDEPFASAENNARDIAEEARLDEIFEQQLLEAYRLYGEKGRGTEIANAAKKARVEHTDPDVREPHWDFKRVVHTNGIHYLPVVHCDCEGTLGLTMDAIAFGLMPASFTQPKTFFTSQLLDFARLCNLELKCSLYQFHQLLLRVTSPMSPTKVKSLYHEFRRMCRLWRWMKKLKWAGFCHHGDPKNPTAGQFTVFCASCPQPGINLPPDWEQDASNPIYGRTFVADGNFKADHVQQKGEDIPLYDGAGIMPSNEQYKEFISKTQEVRTKAACDNSFRAIEAAMTSAKACDITGVVGIACARHGCYCPNGLVDLQRGEQQKNVDYAFAQSLKTSNVDVRQKVTLLYDIACQYFVNLRGRIDPLLSNQDAKKDLRDLVIDRAIGLFHVHAHKDQCFFRFSPTFIPGLGTVAGEILESLWSALNEISISLRTSSLSYRAEMIDDHANDSNHKKMLKMAETLAESLVDAIESSVQHTNIFNDINTRAAKLGIAAQWESEIEAAEMQRMQMPQLMDIYGVDLDKVQQPSTVSNTTPENSETIEKASGTPLDVYLQAAINVEERQFVFFVSIIIITHTETCMIIVVRLELQAIVKKAGSHPSETEITKIENRRETLLGLLANLKELEFKSGCQVVTPVGTTNTTDNNQPPEKKILCLPSNNNIVQDYKAEELDVRIVQATSQLNRIRELIVEKSIQYSHIIRVAKTKAITTRSRQKVNDISDKLDIHCTIYNACHQKLGMLGAGAQTLQQFQTLARSDLNASTALLLPNSEHSTQISLSLSWIWRSQVLTRTGVLPPGSHSASAEDSVHDPVAVQEFLRVHWLRARALDQRWKEEVKLLSCEMEWTVRFFQHRWKEWRSAARNSNTSLPAAAYALRKRNSWLKLAVQADILFKQTNSTYKSPINTK
ncbi:hypothetical protein CVT24_005956 [Panaeolus cyanescens]|uniref:CxC2-like cysteine cluster KDZ transposase-associated domain-containing protein n=1 Tax=Panaeolus cyanescens TaxID=181874 RepID=A0A409YE49_9AGAR|nr:hypothetical protein CVT24_005956 [Panaeolus cyanescens]